MKLSILYNDIFYGSLLNEGVFDKHIFKCIFLAGGSGVGKSFISNNALSGYGLKVVDSDKVFEILMNKQNLSLKMPDSEKTERDAVRDTAKKITVKFRDTYINNRLGIIIDGTGKDADELIGLSEKLKEIGYDTFMVLVTAEEDIAIERNAKRPRSVPVDLLKKIRKQVLGNISRYSNYFGNNFRLLDTSDESKTSDIKTNLSKIIRNFLNKGITNPSAKVWIDSELEKRKR